MFRQRHRTKQIELSAFVTHSSSSKQSVPVTGIFYKSTCLTEVSITEQILWKFQIPRHPEGTEHAQTCIPGSFSLPMHESLGTRLLAKQTSPQNLMQLETRIQSLNLWTKPIVTLLKQARDSLPHPGVQNEQWTPSPTYYERGGWRDGTNTIHFQAHPTSHTQSI